MQIIIYIVIGFIAQMIDGTLGMAYGVSCRSILSVFTKIPPKFLSAVVHYAEIPTSFTSMLSHFKFKNFDRKLFWSLTISGVIGSIIGAYIITLDFGFIVLLVDVYLVIMGAIIFIKSFKVHPKKKTVIKVSKIYILGFVGAFIDAAGGGGYGPIVTGSLISNSENPKKIIGSVNASEFFVTLVSSFVFFLLLINVVDYIHIIFGLTIGGVIAAPLAAKLCLRLDAKKLYFLVGILLVILNLYNIIIYF